MRLLPAVVCVVMLFCLGTFPSLAERRVALVIGNGAYKNAPALPNPRNDASDVAAALKRGGFETIVGVDMDRLGMEDAVIRFAKAARSADVAMFYYSGHAMQFAGVNYLAPVDLKLTDETDLRRMVRLDDVVADLQQAKNLRILVLDACRDNPLADDLKRSIGTSRALSLQRGLAKIDSPQGMIVSYATQAGRTAADGTDRNSPYTAAFLRHIEAPDEIGVVFRKIAADVYEITQHSQLPELSLSIVGEFHLTVNIAAPPLPTAPAPQSDPASQAWLTIKDTTSIAILEEFRRQYPGSVYAQFASARIEELKRASVAVVAPPAAAPAAKTYAKIGNFACFGKAEYPDSWREEAPLCVAFGCNFGKMSLDACRALGARKQSKTIIHGNPGTSRANECWLQHSCGDLRPHNEFTLLKM
jgi:Caspase domain